MKWIKRESLVGKNVHVVELSEEEKKLPDDDLITLADNLGEKDRGVSHFGGTVKRDGDTAEITVYID